MISYHDAAVAQSVERRIGSAEVTGPIPVSSLLKPLIFHNVINLRNLLHLNCKRFLFSVFLLYNKSR